MESRAASSAVSARRRRISVSASLSVDPAVYVVTDRKAAGQRGVLYAVEQALDGGASIVQLRDKHVKREESVALGRELRRVTRRAGALFIVNDDVELAEELEADGVHVGQEDDAASLVRGRVNVLGVSCGTIEEALRAEKDGANYIGVGSIYSTVNKADAGEPIGVEGLRKITQVVKIPVIAIGGISEKTAEECSSHGADGVAVIGAVMGASNPTLACEALRAGVMKGRES